MGDYDSEKMLPVTTVTKLGMNTNIAAMLCYLPLMPLTLVAPAVWLVSEPKNNYFLRFHSTQAVVLGAGYFCIATSLAIMSGFCMFVPFIGHMFVVLFGLLGALATGGFFLTSLFLMYAGFNNRLVKLPAVAPVADKLLTMIDNRG